MVFLNQYKENSKKRNYIGRKTNNEVNVNENTNYLLMDYQVS